MCRQHAKIYLCTRKPEKRARETKEWAEMWQNDTAGSTKIKKGNKRESKQERERATECARGKQDEHFVFVCDFLLIFSTLYSKAKVKWNGCPAEGRNGMAWNGMGWDSMHRLAELRSDR